MRRLLVINPNTNVKTTDRIRAASERAASAGTIIDCVTAPDGVTVIKSLEQIDFAAEVVLSVLAEKAPAVDGAVVAAFSDPGLLQAKRIYPIPIVGIAEAAMLQAAALSDRFSIVTMGQDMPNYLREQAKEHGVAEKLANIRILPWSVRSLNRENYDILVAECVVAIERDRAGAVIIGGGPFAGFAEDIAQRIKMPILDGTVCAVQRVEHLIKTNHLEEKY